MSIAAPTLDETAAAAILAEAGYPPDIVKRLRSGPRPALGNLRTVKGLLAARLGPVAAANALTTMAGNVPGTVETLPMCSLQDFARVHAQLYEELCAPRTVRMPPVPVFGDPGRRGFEARSRSVFCCVLGDTVVSSKSNILVADGHAILDYQGNELEMVPLDLGVDPIVFADAPDHLTVAIERGAIDGEPIREAFTLVGVNSFNYCHWQVEFLPRLMACLDLPGFEAVPILVDAQMPPQHVQALRHVVGAERGILVLAAGEAVRVERLWTCSMVMYMPLWPMPGASYAPQTLYLDTEAFVARLARIRPPPGASGTASRGKRLYLTRNRRQHRRIENQVEVEAWFAANGFEIVDFGALTFPEQLEAVRDASVIVGPDGAALMNSLFAPEGARIGILDNHFIDDNEWYADICARLGQRLGYLVGEVVDADARYEFNANYHIPVEALPGFLDHLLSDPATGESDSPG